MCTTLFDIYNMKLEDEISQKKFKSEYHKAGVNILYTNNWLLYRQSGVLKKQGITSQQYNILRILRGQLPLPASIKTIRERMLDKMSDASRIVEKLRLKGLVERKVSERDRRNVDVLITEKGLQLLQALDQLDELFTSYLRNLSESEVVTLNELLDKLRG